jgi:uncharacterized protein YgiM (DUF1202 family)
VTVVWRGPLAGSDTGRRFGSHVWSVLVRLVCCLGVAAVFSATLLGTDAPVNADPVSNLQAQAAQLSQQMLLEQLQIASDEQQRASDLATVEADDAALQATEVRMDETRHRIETDMRDLRQAAVKAYVEGGTAPQGVDALFSGVGTTASAAVLFDQVMTGNLSAAVARLQTDRQALRVEEATQLRVAQTAQQQEVAADDALASAENAETTLQQQRSEVVGQLAVAIQQQQAAEQAAALAAARSSVPAAGGGASTGSMPALNSFLACVVQAESGGNYHAVSPTGQYMGAFQFSQSTWNDAALLAGMPSLVGVRPDDASPADQDLLAIALYNADGEQPWYDPCRN